MKTTGVSCVTKFRLLIFLGHPNLDSSSSSNDSPMPLDTLYQLISGISSCSMKAATEQELRYSSSHLVNAWELQILDVLYCE